jgi:hypothetical protein
MSKLGQRGIAMTKSQLAASFHFKKRSISALALSGPARAANGCPLQ